jgi:uncharacterized protein YdcH (DUF465 family)
MSNTPHELNEEFPEFAAKMTALKTSNAHFARLAEKYHELNRTIHRAETLVEPMEDLAMDTLRKQRMKLKDEIYAMLRH